MAEGGETRMSFSALRNFHSQKIKEQEVSAKAPVKVPREVQLFDNNTDKLLKMIRCNEGKVCSENVGKDLQSVLMLMDVHSGVERDVSLLEKRISCHLEEADALMQKFPKSRDHIDGKRKDVNLAWKSLSQNIQRRKKKLQQSEQLHMFNEEHRKLSSWMKQRMIDADKKRLDEFSDIDMVELEQLKTKLEEKEKDFNKYCEKAKTLVKNFHPSSKEIDDKIKKISWQWSQLVEKVRSLTARTPKKTKSEFQPIVQKNRNENFENDTSIPVRTKVKIKETFSESSIQEYERTKPGHEVGIKNRVSDGFSQESEKQTESQEKSKVKARVKKIIRKDSVKDFEDPILDHQGTKYQSNSNTVLRESSVQDYDGAVQQGCDGGTWAQLQNIHKRHSNDSTKTYELPKPAQHTDDRKRRSRDSIHEDNRTKLEPRKELKVPSPIDDMEHFESNEHPDDVSKMSNISVSAQWNMQSIRTDPATLSSGAVNNEASDSYEGSLRSSCSIGVTTNSVQGAAISAPKPTPRRSYSAPVQRTNTLDSANSILVTNNSDVHFSSDFLDELKVTVVKVASNRITIQWPQKQLGQKESYFVCYRNLKSGDWTQCKIYWKENKGTIEGLEPETSYQFKVKIWNQSSGDELSHTGLSDVVSTPQSPLVRLRQLCGSDGLLPLQEIRSERNEKDKFRKLVLSDSSYVPSTTEKTVLLIGSTGCGKSTLIDSFANYLVGAEHEGFNFKMVRLEKCEEENAKDKTQSLTEWITRYVIVPSKATEDRLKFTINIVDTPGFGDTRGHDRDLEIIEQITKFFEGEEKLRKSLEAICFIFKASNTRLTPSQRYVCDTIMGLFGKDIKPNICILTTFSYGQRPEVLELLKKMNIPHEPYYEFNNVGLHYSSCSGPKSKLHPQFLEMNNESFGSFIDHLSSLPSQTLTLTLDVLDIRKKIERITDHLDDSIQRALSDIRVFQQEIKVFEEHKSQIERKKDFSYQVDAYVVEEKPIDTEFEYQATNCRKCRHTCHRNCSKLGNKLQSCSAMDENGQCEVCPMSCHYESHYKSSTIFVRKNKMVNKHFREYYASNRPYHEIIDDLRDKIDKYEQTITNQSNLLAALNDELQDTALRPLPTDTNAYFDEMIAELNRVQRPGYKESIAVIQKCRDRMKVDRNVIEFKVKLQKAKKDLQDVVGKKDALSRIRKVTSYLVKPFKSLFR